MAEEIEIRVPGDAELPYLLITLRPRRKVGDRLIEASCRVGTGPARVPVDVFDADSLDGFADALRDAAAELRRYQAVEIEGVVTRPPLFADPATDKGGT